MTSAINWAILGTGRMAQSFATAMAEVEDARLLAVGSRSESTAKEFAGQFGIPNACGSYAEALTHKDVDIVYIATPHSLHATQTVMCLEAGKNVLCEKPFAINAEQASEMINLAVSKNLFLMEAMWTRFVPAIVKLRDMLQQQVIGDVQLMLAGGAYMPDFDPDHYLFSSELGGGILLDAGVYLVSMASMLFSEPVSIQATGELGKTGVDEHDAILLKHANGAIANLYVSNRSVASPDMTLFGTKGKLYIHAPIFCPPELTLTLHGQEPEIIACPFVGNGYQYQIKEVHECLRSGKTASEIMSLEETLSIMTTMDEIRKQIGMVYSVDKF